MVIPQPQITVSLYGFSDKQEIADITEHIVNKLNLQMTGLPSKLTAGRGSGNQGRVIVVSKDGHYKPVNNMTEVANVQWVIDSVHAGYPVST